MGRRTIQSAPADTRPKDVLRESRVTESRARDPALDVDVAHKLVFALLEEIDEVRDRPRRVELLHEVASIQEQQLGDPDGAFKAMIVAWGEDYTDQSTTTALTRLADQLDGWAELMNVALNALELALPPEQQVALCFQCGTWYAHLGCPDNAVACYEQVLTIDAAHRPSLKQLGVLYERAQKWSAAFVVLDRLAFDAEGSEEKAELAKRLTELCEGPLRGSARAASAYREVLAVPPKSVIAADALERVLVHDERWEDAARLIELSAKTSHDAKLSSRAWVRLGKILQDRLGRTDEAIEAYREALTRDDMCLAALQGLEPLLQEGERFRELREVLEGQVRATPPGPEQVKVLTRLATLWEETFIRRDKALACLEQACAIDGDDRTVRLGLLALYKKAQRWEEVLSTLEALLQTDEQTERLVTLRAIAELCATHLANVPRAIRAFHEILAIEESDLKALRELVKLHERAGNPRDAVKILEQLVRAESDESALSEAYFRMGQIYEEEILDLEMALTRYAKAVELAPMRGEMLRALRRAQISANDFAGAARTLVREIELAKGSRALGDLHISLARILSEKLGQPAEAVVHLERACAEVPDNERATMLLASAYVQERNWSRALPLLSRLASGVGPASARSDDRRLLDLAERKRASVLLSEVAGRLGDHALAAKGYERALDLDPTDLTCAVGAASAHFRAEKWTHADKAYERVLCGWGTDLDASTKTEVLRRRGLSLLAVGQDREALSLLTAAHESAPADPLTLRALIALHERAADWKMAVHSMELLANVVPDADKLRLHTQIAKIFREKLNEPDRSIEALRRALERSPDSRGLQHKLLTAYQGNHRWEDAISLLESIAKGEECPKIAAQYIYTAGVVARDQLHEPSRALELFERALDQNTGFLKAFESIDRLLTELKDWKRLERCYRKMIHRVMGSAQSDSRVLSGLWYALGIIYRDRIGDLVSAAGAFEQACALEPENDTKHRILAELYTRIPGEIRKAVDEHRRRIERDPSAPEPYHLLYKIYRQRRELDRALCVANALVALDAANREQQALVCRFRAEPVIRGQIGGDDWLVHLYHPHHDRLLAMLFRSLVDPLSQLRFGPVSAPVRRQKQPELESSPAASALFDAVREALSSDVPAELMVRPSAPHGLKTVAGALPATVAGRVICERQNSAELRFLLGHHVTYLRAEHYIRLILPSRQELGAALLVALHSIGKSDGTRGSWEAWQSLCRIAPEAAVDRIAKACTLFAERGEPASIKRYIQTTELTACRAGLLLSNDVSAALAMVEQLESAGSDDVTPAEKRAAILRFSVSESYFELRKKLGLDIERKPAVGQQRAPRAAS